MSVQSEPPQYEESSRNERKKRNSTTHIHADSCVYLYRLFSLLVLKEAPPFFVCFVKGFCVAAHPFHQHLPHTQKKSRRKTGKETQKPFPSFPSSYNAH